MSYSFVSSSRAGDTVTADNGEKLSKESLKNIQMTVSEMFDYCAA